MSWIERLNKIQPEGKCFKNTNTNGEIYVQRDVNGYGVIIVGRGREYFDTFKEALTYAKRWMKANPNG